MKVVALVSDLLFASNIDATLSRAGHDVHIVESLGSLDARLLEGETALVILDLDAGVAPAETAQVCSAGGAPVLAFGRHTEPELLRAAREAGCAEVVPRSTFVGEMLALVEKVAIANR